MALPDDRSESGGESPEFVGTLALVSHGRFPRLHFSSLVLGVWAVLISSFFLDAKVSAAAPMGWSNTWSGAVLAVLALAELSAMQSAAR